MAQGKLTALPLGLLLAALFFGLSGCGSGRAASGTQRVEIGGETFVLELALTRQARYQGLSDRASIPRDGGMLFVFPREDHREFVMRRCLVPIDILFLKPSGEVMAAHAMAVEPYDAQGLPRYASGGPSSLAVELAGGTIERLGLKVGDRISLPVLELKRRAL